MKRCTGRNCIMQYDKVDPATCQAVDYCPQATPPKTIADKLRAMTDEELAAFLYDTNNLSSWCVGRHGETDCPDGGCLMCWENWLKKTYI